MSSIITFTYCSKWNPTNGRTLAHVVFTLPLVISYCDFILLKKYHTVTSSCSNACTRCAHLVCGLVGLSVNPIHKLFVKHQYLVDSQGCWCDLLPIKKNLVWVKLRDYIISRANNWSLARSLLHEKNTMTQQLTWFTVWTTISDPSTAGRTCDFIRKILLCWTWWLIMSTW